MRFRNFLLFALLFCLQGCGDHSHTKKLIQIDSLVVAEEYDSAYHETLSLDGSHFPAEDDLAHYHLLLTQTSYLTDSPLPPDTMINHAIQYYQAKGDHEKLADAYYYKACILDDNGDKMGAILLYKEAEEEAKRSGNLRQQYKIAESIAYINLMEGNYSLLLTYSQKALQYAIEAGNKNWMAFSYYFTCLAYQRMENMDSLTHYTQKLIPQLDHVYEENLPDFLSCIGYTYYINNDLPRAKDYYQKSLKQQARTVTLENLADIYVDEGNDSAAYQLWKQAFLIDDNAPKDAVMLNMLQYDLLHHRDLQNACERLYNIFAVKDSLCRVLRDRTIQKAQEEYDKKSAKAEFDRKILHWSFITLTLVMMVLLQAAFIRYRKYKEKAVLQEKQMQISHYTEEIRQLNEQCVDADHQLEEIKSKITLLTGHEHQMARMKESESHSAREIDRLNQVIQKYESEITRLENVRVNAETQIDKLNQMVKQLVEDSSTRLNRGRILYEQLQNGGTALEWKKNDEKCFVEYFKAVHFSTYTRIEKKHAPKTAHNALFLILYEMGKDDSDICRIMGITQRGVRSAKHRIRQNSKE